jgi:hypothetical protein
MAQHFPIRRISDFFLRRRCGHFDLNFFSGECFLVGFDDVREKRPVDNFLGLYEEKKKKKKNAGCCLYVSGVFLFFWSSRVFIFYCPALRRILV